VGAAPGRRVDGRRDHETLLAALGIDLPEARRRSAATFGADAVERAAWQVANRRRPLESHLMQQATAETPL
jgi:hypothetical protein